MEESKVQKLIEETIVELGFNDCFLVELKESPNRIEAYLDSDEGVTFEKCRKISRKIEEVLDEELWLGEKYTLEVSSAGVGRPLRLKRQYKKNVGRMIKVKVVNEGRFVGELLEVTEDKIVLMTMVQDPNSKSKKKKIEKRIDINFDSIVESKIKISF